MKLEKYFNLRHILPNAGEENFSLPGKGLSISSTSFVDVDIKGHKKDGNSVAGIFSVFGNRDSYGDIMHVGSMAKTMIEGRSRIKHLWNHDGWDPPIAVINDLFEISRNDLPEAVLKVAPEATGAGVVVRSYLDTPRGREVQAGVKAGAITEMSFAFDIVKADWSEGQDEQGNRMRTRHIREVVLYDTSDVNWGANDATLAVRAIPQSRLEMGLKNFLLEFKAGERNTPFDRDLFEGLKRLFEIENAVKAEEKEQSRESHSLPDEPRILTHSKQAETGEDAADFMKKIGQRLTFLA